MKDPSLRWHADESYLLRDLRNDHFAGTARLHAAKLLLRCASRLVDRWTSGRAPCRIHGTTSRDHRKDEWRTCWKTTSLDFGNFQFLPFASIVRNAVRGRCSSNTRRDASELRFQENQIQHHPRSSRPDFRYGLGNFQGTMKRKPTQTKKQRKIKAQLDILSSTKDKKVARAAEGRLAGLVQASRK